jgi:hypothetical protein
MDSANFTDFIKQSDNDRNSNQGAVVEYHAWRLLPDELAPELQGHPESIKAVIV